MKAISGSVRSISVDLPGHGGSTIKKNVVREPSFSMEVVADILSKLIHHFGPGKVNLVGYIMGARIAIEYLALKFCPGLKDEVARRTRRVKVYGLQSFLDGELWKRELWDELKGCKTPLLIIVGEKDTKFKAIAQQILSQVDSGRKRKDEPVDELHEIVEIPSSGHAAHLENPLAVINALSRFLLRSNEEKNAVFL